MFSSSAVSVMQRASRSGRHGFTPVALTTIATLGVLLSTARTSAAQTSVSQTPVSRASAWELRVTSGAFMPTGSQRSALDHGQVSAAQLSWVVRPSLAVTGTFGWARSRDIISVGAPKLDVFTSDLGIEARHAQWLARRAVTFSPFAGLGAGARSYNYRKLDVDATHNVAAYASAGGELGIARVGLRLEVRDYATGFKPLVGTGNSEARNDVVIMVGLSFNRHAASKN